MADQCCLVVITLTFRASRDLGLTTPHSYYFLTPIPRHIAHSCTADSHTHSHTPHTHPIGLGLSFSFSLGGHLDREGKFLALCVQRSDGIHRGKCTNISHNLRKQKTYHQFEPIGDLHGRQKGKRVFLLSAVGGRVRTWIPSTQTKPDF